MVPNVKRKSRPKTLFQLLTFTFDPFFNVKWGYLTAKALYLFWFSIITDSKVGDNHSGCGLVFSVAVQFESHAAKVEILALRKLNFKV